MRKYTGKPLSIVIHTIFLHILCERVISPRELAEFSQTKWWQKLRIVSFGRFGLSNGMEISKSEISKMVTIQ